MQKKIIETTLAPEAVGIYSQGVEVNGTYYFSGQIGIDPDTSSLMCGFEEQLDRILANIEGLLKSQDLTKDNIVKTTIFITNLENFSLVNKAYESYFAAPYPARSCVEVSALPKNALVEIEFIAVK